MNLLHLFYTWEFHTSLLNRVINKCLHVYIVVSTLIGRNEPLQEDLHYEPCSLSSGVVWILLCLYAFSFQHFTTNSFKILVVYLKGRTVCEKLENQRELEAMYVKKASYSDTRYASYESSVMCIFKTLFTVILFFYFGIKENIEWSCLEYLGRVSILHLGKVSLEKCW